MLFTVNKMKTIKISNQEVEAKNECMRTKVRSLCLEGLLRAMASDTDARLAVSEKPGQPVWCVLDPQSLMEGSEQIEWRFDDLGSSFMLVDSRCEGEDPRSIGAIQVELTFGTARDEDDRGESDEHRACEWTPWWLSLSCAERRYIAREFAGLGSAESAP